MPELKQVGGNMLNANTLISKPSDLNPIHQFKQFMGYLSIKIWELRTVIHSGTNIDHPFYYTIWILDDKDFAEREEKILIWLQGYNANRSES